MAVIAFKRPGGAANQKPRAVFTLHRDGTVRAVITCSSDAAERYQLYLAVRNSIREIFYRHTGLR